MPTIPDYEAPETIVVDRPDQLRALADDVRSTVVSLLRERAYSTQQLSRKLEIPKGTIGHHLKVLERAGLIHVVRTRQVRAVTEKFYGRTARLFVVQDEDPEGERAVGATILRQAAREVEEAALVSFGHPKVRLTGADAKRFERRLGRLFDDLLAADSADGESYAIVAALYSRRA